MPLQSFLMDRLKKELRRNRNIIFWLVGIILACIFLAWGIYRKSITNDQYYSAILLSAAMSIFITAFIQILQNLSIQKTLTEDVSLEITKNVSNEIINIREAKNLLTPSNIYWGGEEHFGNDLLTCTKESSTLRFMSISAHMLLNERLVNPQIKTDRAWLNIQLLLLDPTDTRSLEYRHKQMKRHEEHKSVEELQKEILKSVLSAYHLTRLCSRFCFQIRFHRETLLFRLEFPNENTLFMSYYDSQKSKENLGPVARYQRGNDVFTSHLNYFENVWEENNGTKEISIGKSTNFNQLKQLLTEKFISCESFIEEIWSEYMKYNNDTTINSTGLVTSPVN